MKFRIYSKTFTQYIQYNTIEELLIDGEEQGLTHLSY